MKIKAYQVLNSHGNPASDEFDDLCIFENKENALRFIRHLREDCILDDENFVIRPLTISYKEIK